LRLPHRRLAQASAEIAMISLICVSVLAPPIRFSGNFPYVRAEQILLAMVFVIYAWFAMVGYARKVHFNGMMLIGALYAFCVALSTWYGADMLHHQVIFRDFYQIPKVLFPVLFFTMAYEAELSEESLQTLLKYFSVATLLVCIYAWGQFASLAFTYRLNGFYSGGEHIDLILTNVGRVYSTMGNPNVLGQLMSWCLVAFTMAALSGAGNRLWNIFIAFACLVTLAMTASRYGLITASLGILLIFAFPARSGRRRIAQLILLMVLLPVFALTFKTVATANRSGIQRIQTLKDPLHTDSLQGRLDVRWVDAAHDIARSPWIGNGSAKEFFGDIITDSEYLDMLKQFGIVGFFVYLAYYIFPLHLLSKGLKAARQAGQHGGSLLETRMPITLLTLRLSFVMIILALAMSIGESTFTNLLLQGFLWMWMGLGARCAETLRESSRRVIAVASVRRVVAV
jgi:O-antigen ligase